MKLKIILAIAVLIVSVSSIKVPLTFSQPMSDNNERELFYVSNPIIYGHETQSKHNKE
jgi:hypothetical protein